MACDVVVGGMRVVLALVGTVVGGPAVEAGVEVALEAGDVPLALVVEDGVVVVLVGGGGGGCVVVVVLVGDGVVVVLVGGGGGGRVVVLVVFEDGVVVVLVGGGGGGAAVVVVVLVGGGAPASSSSLVPFVALVGAVEAMTGGMADVAEADVEVTLLGGGGAAVVELETVELPGVVLGVKAVLLLGAVIGGFRGGGDRPSGGSGGCRGRGNCRKATMNSTPIPRVAHAVVSWNEEL